MANSSHETRVACSCFPSRCGGGFRALGSLALGSLSHVASDFVTHANCLLFWPFAEPDLFPAWWKHAWTTVSMPWYREPYPIAPHWVSWALVTVLGAVSFFVCIRREGRSRT